MSPDGLRQTQKASCDVDANRATLRGLHDILQGQTFCEGMMWLQLASCPEEAEALLRCMGCTEARGASLCTHLPSARSRL